MKWISLIVLLLAACATVDTGVNETNQTTNTTRIAITVENESVGSGDLIYKTHFEPNLHVRSTHQFITYFPQDMHSVIYYFHGANQAPEVWVQEQQRVNMLEQAVARGYGVIIPQSRPGGRWTPTNPAVARPDLDQDPDVRRIGDIRRDFHLWEYNEFGIGFSSGGHFSTLAALEYNFNAVAPHFAGGFVYAFNHEEYTTPTLFVHGLQDTSRDANPEVISSRIQLLHNRSITAHHISLNSGHEMSDDAMQDVLDFFDQHR